LINASFHLYMNVRF